MSGLKSVYKRRELIGEPNDVYSYQAALLNIPGGKRDIAKRATDTRFSTNLLKGEGLCKELNDNLYKEKLYEIAINLGFPVTHRLTKAELCRMISKYAEEADIDVPEEVDYETHLPKLLPVRMIYDEAYEKYKEDLYDKRIINLSDEFGSTAFPTEFAQLAILLDGSQVNAFTERMWSEGDYQRFGDNNYMLSQVKLGDLLYPLDDGGYLLPIVDEALALGVLHPDQKDNFLSFVRFLYDNRVWEEDSDMLKTRKDSGWFSLIQ